ncbi:uncharacterized protein [Haliotis cracherodii]|uniref:uncharacterized protein n=1 Tax=Haliotis cracherodii TaxID=6455 RepID=UPI0039ED1B54
MMTMELPSADWELNILMLRIGRELDDDDFQSMKFLCSGQRGVPQGVLERLSTPQKFFTYLRERRMLSRDNLLLLQAFLWHVGRLDLHQVASDYARKVGSVLHFFSPDGQPESGYENVKFHVEGDLDNFQRRELEDLRANVARLLFIPPEFVFVSGLEPSNSLLITLMISSFCAKTLRDIATSVEGRQLRKLGVDTLYFGEEEVRVQDTPPLTRKCSIQEEEMIEMYKRTHELEVRVTQMEISSVEVKEEQEDRENELINMRAKETYFRGLLCAALDSKTRGQASSPQPVQSNLPLCLENGQFVI